MVGRSALVPRLFLPRHPRYEILNRRLSCPSTYYYSRTGREFDEYAPAALSIRMSIPLWR
jgi:hypothetical protein